MGASCRCHQSFRRCCESAIVIFLIWKFGPAAWQVGRQPQNQSGPPPTAHRHVLLWPGPRRVAGLSGSGAWSSGLGGDVRPVPAKGELLVAQCPMPSARLPRRWLLRAEETPCLACLACPVFRALMDGWKEGWMDSRTGSCRDARQLSLSCCVSPKRVPALTGQSICSIPRNETAETQSMTGQSQSLVLACHAVAP